MSDVGQILRRARMNLNISLEQLEEMTKIRKLYLEAIEDGNYDILPGSFYVKGFIKNYAESVGLDPNEVLFLYQKIKPDDQDGPGLETIRRKRSSSSKLVDILGKWASTVLMVSFVLLIIGVVYFYAYYNTKDNTSDEAEKNPRITDSMPSPDTIPLQTSNPLQIPTPSPSPELPKADVTYAGMEKGVDLYHLTGADKLTVQIKVVGLKCWMQLTSIDEEENTEKIYSDTANKDQELEWTIEHAASLTLGSASSVELFVNGTQISVGDAANVKKFKFEIQ